MITDWSYVEERGPIACEVSQGHYTCMYCNKGYQNSYPDFVMYRVFGESNWLVRAGFARPGDRMALIYVDKIGQSEHGYRTDLVSGGYEKLGWFAHCSDKAACARRKANLFADQHPEQEQITVDEFDAEQQRRWRSPFSGAF